MGLKKDNIDNSTDSKEKLYKLAAKRVEEIKSFYIHLVIYVLVNIMIFFLINDYSFNNIKFHMGTLATPFFWGIGLFCHWANVFGPSVFFGKKWEEKKIRELMEKDRQTRQKWE